MNRFYLTLLVVLASCSCINKSYGQVGSFTATITPVDSRYKAITISVKKSLFPFNDAHGYWFIHPRSGSHHFSLYPPQGYGYVDAAFINLNGDNNDYDLYTLTSADSNSITLKNQDYGITAPAWHSRDKETLKPMHIHFTTFTASEAAFTITGFAQVISTKGNGEDLGIASITATGHFYREPQYAQSAILPGCNCDPTIYARTFDAEGMVRSRSDCEAALRNKIFDAVQRSMTPLFSNVSHAGNKVAGDINISMLPGCVDVNVPLKDRPYCSDNFFTNGTTASDAQKKNFTNDDGFGLRFIKLPSNEDLGSPPIAAAHMQEVIQKQVAFIDSMQKLMAAKKITTDQFTKAVQAFGDKHPLTMDAPTKDLKKMEAEYNLYVHIIINANNATDSYLKLADRGKTVIQHNITGSAFEVYSPLVKDGDGSWLASRMGIYFGKFTAPAMNKPGDGYDTEKTLAMYPADGNKLTIYNIIIKMEGGKELMDKAIANIDFTALQNLLIKQ